MPHRQDETAIDNWILEPTTRVGDIVREAAYVGIVPKSLIIAAGFRTFAMIARERFVAENLDPTGIDLLLEFQESIEVGARELLSEAGDDAPLINRHSAISLWTILETMVEDTFVLAVRRDARALRLALESSGNRKRALESTSSPISEDDARDLFEHVLRAVRDTNDVNSASRLAPALRAIQIPLKLETPTEKAVVRLCAARNCILHRGGDVDARTARAFQDEHVIEGSRLIISKRLWDEFYEGISQFGSSLIKAITRSPYCRFRDSVTGEIRSGIELDPSSG